MWLGGVHATCSSENRVDMQHSGRERRRRRRIKEEKCKNREKTILIQAHMTKHI